MPVDISNVMERLKKFVLQHPEMSKSGFIQGLDRETGKIIIVVNGEKKYITIDELERGQLNNNVQQTPVKDEEIEVMEEPSVNNQNIVNNQQRVLTLKDIDEAAKVKNEDLINKTLETFAIDSNTGNISINKAIFIVTENATKNVVASVRDNQDLPIDLSAYDAMGNLIVKQVQNQQNVDVEDLIRKSFETIKVYVGVARLKNVVYNEEQVAAAYKNYSDSVHKKLKDFGLEKKENNVVDLNEYKQNKEENTLKKELKPDANLKKAGFADIIILTIIVLIYAAIIINLVSKLN